MQTIDCSQSLCAHISKQDKLSHLADLEFLFSESESPATERVFTPDASSSTSDPTALAASAISDAIPQPLTTGSLISEIPTPLQETLPDFGMSSLVGSVVPLNPAALPTPPIAKASRNLRLPSFDLLGIAAPHPDRIASINYQATPFVGAGPLSHPDDPLHLLESPFRKEGVERRVLTEASPLAPSASLIQPLSESTASISPDQLLSSHKSIQQYIITTTPPDDEGKVDWGVTSNIKASALGSSDQGSASVSNPTSSHGEPSTAATSIGTPGIQGPLQAANPPNSPWLRDVIALILNNLDTAGGVSGRVTVMSHALPLPSGNGHAFSVIINSIHERSAPKSTVWINVFHAVPGSINLANIPTSPPTTPAPPPESEDYFTTQVFDSAVAVPDYQAEEVAATVSPHPVVAPSSVDVTIVERYIPPTSEKEFSELFFTTGRSILSDRIVELSPSNGTLVFIYPTKRGGQTFVKEYLSPIIEPILRAMMVGDNLPYSLVSELGQMPAVSALSTYEEMRARLEDFCQQLSAGGTTPLTRFNTTSAVYTIIHASKQEVTLTREVWAKEWWNKQEKPRVRRLVRDYHGRVRRTDDGTSPPFMGTELVERLLDRVTTGRRSIRADSSLGGTGSAIGTPSTEFLRPLSRDTEQPLQITPASPIEVAVFVIKKSTGSGA